MQKHGGARAGSGRKTKPLIMARKGIAEAVLSGIDEVAAWTKLIRSEDEKIVLATLKYLVDRRDGTPAQSVAVRDVTEPSRRALPSEYVSAVKAALGFSERLKPLVTIEEESGPRLRALPD